MAANKLFILLNRACNIAGIRNAKRRVITSDEGHLFIDKSTCTGRKVEYSIAMHEPGFLKYGGCKVPIHPFGEQRLHKSEMEAYLRGMDTMACLLTGFTYLDVRTYLNVGFDPLIRNRMERRERGQEGGEE